MEKFLLMKPTEEYLDNIKAFREEFVGIEQAMDGCASLIEYDNITEWLERVELFENIESVPEFWVQTSQYIYVRKQDQKIVGMIQVRHARNDYIEKIAGDIGYSICPSERGKGYATSMLKCVIEQCRMFGMKNILITCMEGNIASQKVITKNAGRYESTIVDFETNKKYKRYWINIV